MSARDTLAAQVEFAQEIRKSRFLARGAPVDSASAAQEFIVAASDPSATHNCWAWRLGEDYRSSDDGEPGGSAGRPILAAIDGQGFDRVAVVVTRWFGGIRLGVGGLVRAYGGCAAECLRTAPRRPLVAMREFLADCDFGQLALLRARLGQFEAEVADEHYHASGVTLRLRLPESRARELGDWWRDFTRGQGSLRPVDA